MLKRLSLACAGLFAFVPVAMASGTIPFSLSQQFDSFGKPLSGCKFYTIVAGTTSTPQNSYQDAALTIPLPNPIVCDAAGRLPQFFVADGTIKVRLDNAAGVNQITADGVQVIGPSGGGGGGGGSVDSTTIFATGDVKQYYGTGTVSGWVRMNGRTIGSATSGASERANADCQALFQYLWGADANLAVSGGRGASATADWAANKTITLPDARNRALAGLGDMGSSDANLYSGTSFTNGNGTTLGSRLGIGTPKTIALSELPNFAPAFTGITDAFSGISNRTDVGVHAVGTTFQPGSQPLQFVTDQTQISISGTFTPRGTVQSINGGQAQTGFTTVPPLLLVTTYMKL